MACPISWPCGTPGSTARCGLESKAKAQKIVNLRRDDRLSVMVEAGNTYDTLRGVSLEGRGIIVEDPEAMWRVGVSVRERYTGPLHRGVQAAC